MAICVADVECYPNYFLLLSTDIKTGQLYRWERHNDVERGPYTKQQLAEHLMGNTIVGFNWHGYDEFIVNGYFSGYSNAQMNEVTKFIIEGDRMNRYKVYNEENYGNMERIPYKSIDIMPIAPLMASLKIYAGRIGHPSLQDLPIEPGTIITEDMRNEMLPYCSNDLGSTTAVLKYLKPQITLRKQMSDMYGLDLLSKSDAQIAEGVIRKKLSEEGIEAKPIKGATGKGFYKYDPPEWMQFTSPELCGVFDAVVNSKFEVTDKGTLTIPPDLRKAIVFEGKKYKMGVGGLHSQEKARSIICKPGERLFDIDITSYYPNIIINNKYHPKQLGHKFLEVYKSIVDERIRAKKSASKLTKEIKKLKEELDAMG